jgi:hypothetical protein
MAQFPTDSVSVHRHQLPDPLKEIIVFTPETCRIKTRYKTYPQIPHGLGTSEQKKIQFTTVSVVSLFDTRICTTAVHYAINMAATRINVT